MRGHSRSCHCHVLAYLKKTSITGLRSSRYMTPKDEEEEDEDEDDDCVDDGDHEEDVAVVGPPAWIVVPPFPLSLSILRSPNVV